MEGHQSLAQSPNGLRISGAEGVRCMRGLAGNIALMPFGFLDSEKLSSVGNRLRGTRVPAIASVLCVARDPFQYDAAIVFKDTEV